MERTQQHLHEPLLPLVSSHEHEAQSKQQPQLKHSNSSRWVSNKSFLNCTFNLAKVITGAGMMAIPRAYTQIGSLLGTGMLLGVAALTYWTLAVLVTGSARTGATTYPQLTSALLGRTAAKVLQVAVLCFCAGFNVVYLVVAKDILLGTPPHCNGLLCEMFGVANSGPWSNPAYIICGVALTCAPFLMLRSMEKLSFLNIVGVAATILLAAAAAGLGLIATLQGTAYPVPLTPQWKFLGPTSAAQFEALTDVLPVILACYVAHQSLHPLMPLLKPYSPGRMCGVAAAALAIVACIFLMLSFGAALAFGPELDINALSNFTEEGMAPFVGLELARVLSWVIRGGYLVALLANLLLYMHPLRAYIAEIMWPEKVGSTAGNEQQQTLMAGCSSSGVAPVSNVPVQQAATDGTKHSRCFPAQAQPGEVAETAAFESAAGSYNSTDGLAIVGDFEGNAIEVVDAADSKPAAVLHRSGMGIAMPGDVQTAVNGCVNEVIVTTPLPAKVLLRWQKNEQRWYYPLTYGLLVALIMMAILVPNIWQALSAIGDLASTVQAFVIPGLIATVLAADSRQRWQQHVDLIDLVVDRDGDVPQMRDVTLQNGLLIGSQRFAGPELPLRQYRQWRWCLNGGDVQWGLYSAMGWLVVVLGVALFANGIWQRM